MEGIYEHLSRSIEHLRVLNNVFLDSDNYSDSNDHELYMENLNRLTEISQEIGIPSEMYSMKDRQMKLADLIEYVFFSRGTFSLIKGNSQFKEQNIPKFIELILAFVNLLMSYEITTVDIRIRNALLSELSGKINGLSEESEFDKLLNWEGAVGIPKKNKTEEEKEVYEYFDSLLPKTAGGLWHEMLTYAFVLRFNIGYIFPLLLHQKVFSLEKKLSPPDLIILHHKTARYYGIEIGDLKEKQSGGFMLPTGAPVIPIDTRDCRISDRCPTCLKWIGMCPKVIDEFSDPTHEINRAEIRCLYDCDRFTLKEKLEATCPYIKYFDGSRHHHYRCVVGDKRDDIGALIKRKHKISDADYTRLLDSATITLQHDSSSFSSKKVGQLKTHYLWYSELRNLM